MANWEQHRHFWHHVTDRELLEKILEITMSNATALTDLQTAVANLQTAAGTVPADTSAGVEAAAADVQAVADQLAPTTAPPATATASDVPPPATVGGAAATDPKQAELDSLRAQAAAATGGTTPA